MSVGLIGAFEMRSAAWASYVDRLEMYFVANGIKPEVQLPTLIAVMGEEAYELLVNLASPRKPSELKFKEAVDLMQQHLEPTPSVLAERYKFRQRRQTTEENVSEYVAELKKLSRYLMSYGSAYSPKTTLDLTYTKAVKIASTLEAAERDSAAVEKPLDGGSQAIQAVNAISHGGERGVLPRVIRGKGARDGAPGLRGGQSGQSGSVGAERWRGGAAAGERDGGRYAVCTGCGSSDHRYAVCRFRNYMCSWCRRKGHLRRACPERGGRGSGGRRAGDRAELNYAGAEDLGEESLEENFHHLCLNDYRPVSLPVVVDAVTINMEVDTGSAVSCISADTYNLYFKHHRIQSSALILNFYDGSKIKPLGLIKPMVRYGDHKKRLELFIITGGNTSLLGRQWLTELNIRVPMLSVCHKIDVNNGKITWSTELNKLCSRYKELFSGGLGRFTGGQATLRVREGATPVFHRARPLPYALRERVDAELDRMLRDGVIEPVDCSDWASPLVPVNKADGSLRVCADYKATLNPVLQIDRYPLPRIEDLMVRLSGACFFSKIDLSQAYNQIELDDTKKYTVINTHRGLYRYNRLVYGLASSPGIFQRIMCNLLRGIPNVEIFLDDVIIGGKTISEHLEALQEVFSRLHNSGLKLKSSKCVFLVNEIRYLGYVISKDGIKTDPSKIEAIAKLPRPSNVSELRSFLGILNFYGKFIKNMSSRLVPLYELLKKDTEWNWSAECENAFIKIKKILSSVDTLAHYDSKKPLVVTCDASGRGIGGVLTQIDAGSGGERPVAYASRTLTDAEKNYSQIHREALAIIFCVNKFHQYLYGRHFTLRTDHKPLVSIFGPNTGIPAMVASRMQRWAIILSAYSFDIEYVRTDENSADGLSRLPIDCKQSEPTPPEQTYLHCIQDSLCLDYNEIKNETIRDPILAKVLLYIRDGWPAHCELTNMKPYWNRRNELYEELGCVMWGHRLVVPEKCKSKILKIIHEPHMGIVKSKALARSYVWWAGIDEAVERACRECEACAAQADAPPRQTPRMWPWPSRPWTRLHLDFLGPIGGKTFLVVVDAMSKWIEVFHMTGVSASYLIDRLNELFSRFGIPKQIVTDNGTQFASKEFEYFNQYYGIQHIFTPPYHPSSNGLAENAVKTLKRIIKKALQEKRDINRALWSFLLYYRNVEHCTTGESPAMLLLGRPIRTRLDVIRPDREGKVRCAQQRQQEAAGGANRTFDKSDTVWYRQYLKGEKWIPGQVVEVLGSSNFRVRGSDGGVVHRHIDQLRRRPSESRQSLASAPSVLGEQLDSANAQGSDPEGAGSEEDESEGPTGERAPRVAEPPASQPQPAPASPGGSGHVSAAAALRVRPIRQCRLVKPK
ncbi:uncharacterized protein K02A2.6-like [Papilio machaon]|uniref:uncharacterized protein K02A2.6-like n=1 Tax=Papilio machaon TaxID=76193 RepID=UPI001E6642FC|nr:uncharacterized protein K02A2.6-like [Papilio machaon]